MNKNISILLLLLQSLFAMADETSESIIRFSHQKTVKSVEYLKSDKSLKIPKSANDFFISVLKKKESDDFRKSSSTKLDKGNENFGQYYRGIEIEGAGYAFHYDNEGRMYYAHGNYEQVNNLDITPLISGKDAMELFAKHKGFDIKQVSDYSSKLIIKMMNEKDKKTPHLSYKVFLNINHPENTEYGYVDAHTGKILGTESFVFHLTSTGNFELLYQTSNKTAQTDYTNNGYRLFDNSMGATIHTRDLANNTIDYYPYSYELYDSDNVWHQSEFSGNTGMALDVHWGLQKICDRLYGSHGRNSFDNNGKAINAYIRANFDTYQNPYYDNAAFINYYDTPLLLFGIGGATFKPLAALDVVAHEFGHAITAYQIGWSNTETYLDEGLSDIWAAIMDYRYGDSNSDAWKIGEQVIKGPSTCLRDIGEPFSILADTQMADTYGTQGYDGVISPYTRSGVFSHWFYLLVNGGSGYNGKGNYYNLTPIGMDVAEDLIVNAVYDGALRYTESYEDVRNSFAAVARNMNIDGLEAAVCNAWYAVGVGDDLEIIGPKLINNSGTFSVDGLPSGFTVEWKLSDSYYNQHCLQQSYPAQNQCTITYSAGHYMINATLTATIKYNGNTIQTLTKTVCAYDDIHGQYTSDNLSGEIDGTHRFYVKPNVISTITSPMFQGASVGYDYSGTIPTTFNFSVGQQKLYFTMPANNNGKPVIINVEDICGNHYKLYAMPYNSYYMNIAYSDGSIDIEMKETVAKDIRSDVLKTMETTDNQTWQYEIWSTSKGTLKAAQTVYTRSTTISTAGWPKGVYVIKARIGKEEVTEKFVVK